MKYSVKRILRDKSTGDIERQSVTKENERKILRYSKNIGLVTDEEKT